MIEFREIQRTYPLIDTIGRYIDLRKKGKYYVGLCPFHNDRNPSLYVFRCKDGVERYRCFACDEAGDIIDFVANIENVDKREAASRITGEKLPQVGEFSHKSLPPDKSSEWKPIIPVPLDAPPYRPEFTYKPQNNKTRNWQPLVTRQDPYKDGEGRLMFWVVRLQFPDGGKACPQVTYCEGPNGERKWCARRMDPPYPLMGLDELTFKPDAYVMLLSGEKCREEHQDFFPQMVAVTWLGGDGAIDEVDWTPLANRNVTYWADRDASGRRAMYRIHQKLKEIEKAGTG